MISRIFLMVVSVIASILLFHVVESPAVSYEEIDCAGVDNCKIRYEAPGCTFPPTLPKTLTKNPLVPTPNNPRTTTEAQQDEEDPTSSYPYGLIEFALANCTPTAFKACIVKETLPSGRFESNEVMYAQMEICYVDNIGVPLDISGLTYRKYGPTPDNPVPHWYDFMWDGQTGAEKCDNCFLLWFVDGQRGDDDLMVNDVIVDQGGAADLEALADSILFPWIVKSDDVTTVISVVNTAQTWAESVGLPFHDNRIHIEYWHKQTTANDQEEKCIEYNFEVTSSKDDMVTWDMAGHFNNGLPMFGDTSNEVIGVPDMTLAVENPRRAFLIVDNYTDALTDAGTNVDGTMYGEATIIEHKTGAAWGYIGYNAIGGPHDFSDIDHRDQQGEVIGRDETTQTTLLNPNDATTKLFVTPTWSDQRQGNMNVRTQLCRFPERMSNGLSGSDPYTGDCTGGGIWNNEEGGFSFTTKKDIVCTTADNIVEFFGGAGTSAYTQWVASGKAGWAYLITHWGNIDNRDGTEAYEETPEAAIGKLEFGTGLSWDGGIADTINTFVWLRDNASYMEHCLQFPTDVRCDPGGINIIHNEFYQEGTCCVNDAPFCIDRITEDDCSDLNGVVWFPGITCDPDPCG